MRKTEKDIAFDRSCLPYDAMGDYSAFTHQQDEEEEKPCEDQVRNKSE